MKDKVYGAGVKLNHGGKTVRCNRRKVKANRQEIDETSNSTDKSDKNIPVQSRDQFVSAENTSRMFPLTKGQELQSASFSDLGGASDSTTLPLK
ncbi:Ubiquitin-like protein, partial [Sesbania bispinosa]